MIKFAKNCILFQILFLFANGLLRDFGLPRSALYLMDGVNLVLIGCMLLRGDPERLKAGRVLLTAGTVWLIFMVMSACINGPSLLRMAWAGRNWCRGFVLLTACLLFLDGEDVKKGIRLLEGLYIANFLLNIGQYLLLDRSGDALGGLFGSEVGANAMTNLFLCMMLTLALCRSCREKRLSPFTLFVMYSAAVMGGLEEIKIFFLEYVLILAGVLSIFGLRRELTAKFLVTVLIHGGLSLGLGLYMLRLVSPKTYLYMVGQRDYSEYEKTSRSAYRISRIHFLSEINQFFFHGDVQKNLIGLGFGNCDFSRFEFLTSRFYNENWEYNYLFFSHQPLYLEGGLIGLTLYTLIPFTAAVSWGLRALREKTAGTEAAFGCIFGLVTAVNVFYNNAARTEAAYLTFLAFAAVCLCSKRNWGSQDETN